MANFKTNVIKPFKAQGGTFCTFASALEDIGLNINEKSNKVRLSHYAILDIPNCDYTNQNPNKNVLNLLTPPDAFNNGLIDTPNATNDSENSYARTNIAQSFMSYALNMEAVIRNNNTTHSYDFTRNLTISERVFWKWLKECGAINWKRVENSNYFIEMPNDENYKRVVKSFGSIDAVAQRSSDYGMYNEIYVNIPTSFGGIDNIYFKQQEDDNYSFDKKYETNNVDLLENHSIENNYTNSSSLNNKPYFDYSTKISNNNSHYINDKNGYWFNNITTTEGKDVGYYITDKKIEGEEKLFDTIKVENNDISYVINRSKLDCMTLELDLNKLGATSYDELNIGTDTINSINNYTFNSILVFYSIYDNNDNILATNLYGVYFIDTPIQNEDTPSNLNFINFEIPRLTKKKSTTEGFGTSYSFRFNIRTSSLFDGEDDIIYDNASSENSLVNDFNDVVANLNRTINLLNKNTKHTFIIQEKYNELNQKYENIYNNLIKLTERVNELEKIHNN